MKKVLILIMFCFLFSGCVATGMINGIKKDFNNLAGNKSTEYMDNNYFNTSSKEVVFRNNCYNQIGLEDYKYITNKNNIKTHVLYCGNYKKSNRFVESTILEVLNLKVSHVKRNSFTGESNIKKKCKKINNNVECNTFTSSNIKIISDYIQSKNIILPKNITDYINTLSYEDKTKVIYAKIPIIHYTFERFSFDDFVNTTKLKYKTASLSENIKSLELLQNTTYDVNNPNFKNKRINLIKIIKKFTQNNLKYYYPVYVSKNYRTGIHKAILEKQFNVENINNHKVNADKQKYEILISQKHSLFNKSIIDKKIPKALVNFKTKISDFTLTSNTLNLNKYLGYVWFDFNNDLLKKLKNEYFSEQLYMNSPIWTIEDNRSNYWKFSSYSNLSFPTTHKKLRKGKKVHVVSSYYNKNYIKVEYWNGNKIKAGLILKKSINKEFYKKLKKSSNIKQNRYIKFFDNLIYYPNTNSGLGQVGFPNNY